MALEAVPGGWLVLGPAAAAAAAAEGGPGGALEGRPLEGRLVLRNPSAAAAAWKAMVTRPQAYHVTPSTGYLRPGGEAELTVSCRPEEEDAGPLEFREKLLVVSKGMEGVGDADLDGGKPSTTVFSLGDIDRTQVQLVKAAPCAGLGAGTLLVVSPEQLTFPKDDRATRPVQLENRGDAPVAFRVQVTAVEAVVASPSVGVVPPHSQVAVNVAVRGAPGAAAAAQQQLKVDAAAWDGGAAAQLEEGVFARKRSESQIVDVVFA